MRDFLCQLKQTVPVPHFFMGRSRAASLRRREEAAAKLVEAGAKSGAERERLFALLLAAEFVLAAEVREVLSVLLERGIGAALTLLEEMAGRWRARWTVALQPALFRVMDEAPVETDRGTARPPLGDRGFARNYAEELAGKLVATSTDRIGEILREAQREGFSVNLPSDRTT